MVWNRISKNQLCEEAVRRPSSPISCTLIKPPSCADKLYTVPDQEKPPVFLLDAMSFIFRAYHAMQRSRPMSTRSGLPTAATYVFVNMISKLRQDFRAKVFRRGLRSSAAQFSAMSGPGHRHPAQMELQSCRLEDVSYEGYKAKRESMPEDLRRQVPYIRRSLEALAFPSSRRRALRRTT